MPRRVTPIGITPDKKIGFVLSTKDRPDLTRRCLDAFDTEESVDLIWLDGSTRKEGKALATSYQPRSCRIVERWVNITGGPDAAIQFGLRRLLARGYDYCGLIENDILLAPDWLSALADAAERASADGLNVGAVSARTLETRVMLYRSGYALLWNAGAAIVLFTHEAARIVLATYQLTNSRVVGTFYLSRFSLDLRKVWELWMAREDRALGADWAHPLHLYRYGLSTVGTVPSTARNMDVDIRVVLRSDYVREQPAEPLRDYPQMDLRQFASLRGSVFSSFKRAVMLAWDTATYRRLQSFKGHEKLYQRAR